VWRGLKDRQRIEEPPQTHGNAALEVLWTVVPLLIVGVLFALTAISAFSLHGLKAPEDALSITVIGWQFWWEMRYTEEGIVAADELVLPVGRPVRLELFYLVLIEQQPATPGPLPAPPPPPEIAAGPHLSYALQFFVFALIGIVGYGLLLPGC
jgi:hypothetical protein